MNELTCATCRYYLGGGCCRIHLEDECCEGGGFEAYEERSGDDGEIH